MGQFSDLLDHGTIVVGLSKGAETGSKLLTMMLLKVMLQSPTKGKLKCKCSLNITGDSDPKVWGWVEMAWWFNRGQETAQCSQIHDLYYRSTQIE